MLHNEGFWGFKKKSSESDHTLKVEIRMAGFLVGIIDGWKLNNEYKLFLQELNIKEFDSKTQFLWLRLRLKDLTLIKRIYLK